MFSYREANAAVETFLGVLEEGDGINSQAFDGWISWGDVEALYRMAQAQRELLYEMAMQLDARGAWNKVLAEMYHELNQIAEG